MQEVEVLLICMYYLEFHLHETQYLSNHLENHKRWRVYRQKTLKANGTARKDNISLF